MKLEVTAGSPVHGGYTIARVDGRVILVEGAAPGEKVEIEVDETEKLWRGSVTSVIEPSADRVDHVWDVAGGAELGYLKRSAQLAWKTAVIDDAIAHIGGRLEGHLKDAALNVRVREVGPGLGTRTRLDLDVDESGRLAMHARGSDDLIAIDTMPLAAPAINAILADQDSWEGTWAPGDRVRIVAPTGQGPVVAVGKDVFRAPGQKTGPRVIERAAGYAWEVTATGFWQTHERAPVTLIDAVIKGARLRKSDRVAEFYGGAGPFTLPPPEDARSVGMWGGRAATPRGAQRHAPAPAPARVARHPRAIQ